MYYGNLLIFYGTFEDFNIINGSVILVSRY